jgi:hypothetical protein
LYIVQLVRAPTGSLEDGKTTMTSGYAPDGHAKLLLIFCHFMDGKILQPENASTYSPLS